MARVTVEDCMLVVENRFELVILASQRSKEIAAGAPLTIARDNDKNPIIALREVAAQTVDTSTLKELVLQNQQKKVKIEDKTETVDAEIETELTMVSTDEIVEDIDSFSDMDDALDDEPEMPFDEGDLTGISFDEDNIEVQD